MRLPGVTGKTAASRQEGEGAAGKSKQGADETAGGAVAVSAEKKIPEAKEPRGKTQKGRQKGERPGDTTGDDGVEVFLEQERTSARGGLSGASARRRYRSPAEGNEYTRIEKVSYRSGRSNGNLECAGGTHARRNVNIL